MSPPSSRSSLYWKPEHPPPSTDTLNHPSPAMFLSLETAESDITRLLTLFTELLSSLTDDSLDNLETDLETQETVLDKDNIVVLSFII